MCTPEATNAVSAAEGHAQVRHTPTNDQQQFIDAALGDHAILVAGPGTGKTQTLQFLSASLVDRSGAEPDLIAVLTLTRPMAAMLAEHRENQFGECRSAGEVPSSWIWTRAEAVGIRRTLPIGADAESEARHDSVATVADPETRRARASCEASVGSPVLGASAAVLGFLLGVTALLAMLWVWFGTRKPEDGR